MPLYSWNCPNDHVFDAMGKTSYRSWKKCPQCGSRAKKLPVFRSIRCGGDSGPEYRASADVVDKDDVSCETREFITNPCRDTRDRYMKSKGIRFLEDGEPVKMNRHREAEFNKTHMPKIIKEVAEKHMKDKRIKVGS